MKTTWTKKEKSEGELLVTVNGEEWKKAQDKAFKKLAAKVEIDGFRKGAAPLSLVKKQLKEDAIMFEAVEENATEWLFAGIDEHKIEMITRPTLDIPAMTADEVTVKFIITVSPEVKLGKYTGLNIKKGAVTVKDKDVENRLKQLQDRFAELTVKEGKIKKGDTAIIDFEGFKDGIAFEGGKGENYPLEIGSNSFIPGFEEQLIGLKAEDEKDINVTFPEDYQAEELKGQAVVFKIKVHDVKERVLPELNDEFAKEVDIKGVETLEQLKEHLLNELTKEKEEEVNQKAENDLMSKVVDAAEVDIPQVMIDEEVEQMFAEFKNRLTSQGLTMELYEQFTQQKEADVKEQMKTDAENRVKVRLVLSEIAKAEKIEVSDEEVEKEYEEMAKIYQMEITKIKEGIDPNAIKYDLRIRKAYDLVKENIK